MALQEVAQMSRRLVAGNSELEGGQFPCMTVPSTQHARLVARDSPGGQSRLR
ncbi:hypothetical protein AYL99_12071 [Fonsecaea erecta]|uniref:Uncharacterized protein n=1 Tax=Fonsecaea erecta TaxID=1367422 RepID=A0A178Z2L5_9EURO|nr:hypothetical protein AYL99_12071 [Fonsecaea erecta]OAP53751.1 hypothetical protein AYL99_12071 [Fonsecaea erecta]